jgi:hypothetical protein
MGLHLFMPKKQPIAKVTAPSAAPARSVKPRTTRVTSVKHSKPQGLEAPVEEIAVPDAVSAPEPVATSAGEPVATPHEAIATIAYGYWAARGFTGGNADEDWIRAEEEYLSLAIE